MILLLPSDRLQRGPVALGNAQKTGNGNPYVSSMATTGYHAHLFHPTDATRQSQIHNCSTTARGNKKPPL